MPTDPKRALGPLSSPPPEAWQPLVALARIASRPLERFLRIEAASGILLLVAAILALICANSPWEKPICNSGNCPSVSTWGASPSSGAWSGLSTMA